jgi:uncharacterized membrane protein
MISKEYAVCSAALVALMTAAGVYAIAHVAPDARVAVHFGADGVANGWMRPARAFLLLPAVAALIWGVLAVAPRLDPRGANLARSQTAYGVIWLAVTLLLAVTQAAVIGVAAGKAVPVTPLFTAGLGGVLLVCGNFMGKLRPNNFVGIRTPWTRADDRVWDRTHRFGGFVFVLAGLAMIVLAFVIRDPRMLTQAMAFIPAAAVLLPVAWSYWIWRKMKKEAVLF